MRYISTRGQAPILSFEDVMLSGLARDGGLYVPESWPQIPPETIAGFAGRPYAEVAVEVIRPFVGGAISDTDLSRMARIVAAALSGADPTIMLTGPMPAARKALAKAGLGGGRGMPIKILGQGKLDRYGEAVLKVVRDN